MEIDETTNKPKEGTWDNMVPSGDRKPKVEFLMKEPIEVTFAYDFDKPNEFTSKDRTSVYYLFNCLHNGESKVFLTSAWSLLKGLKDITPLAGKTVLITKDMKDGKQHYSVQEVESEDNVQVVKPGEDTTESEEESTPEVPVEREED